MSHVEFPALTPETIECLVAAYKAAFPWHEGYKEDWTKSNRKGQAAFLREVINQAQRSVFGKDAGVLEQLKAIANNLHSPPPPPPTLAEAREADLETQEGIETVRAFLAALGGGQP